MSLISSKKSATVNMTTGSIAGHMLQFAIPLLIGNIFQMLYNTVDSLVVGNFVGTEALAAIGSTTQVVNLIVLFFNGLSTGATVLIGQIFGAKDKKRMHTAIETTMAMTFISCVIFTIIGVWCVPYMLRFMATPEDVLGPASTYLRIYFAGVTGVLIYNMGSGILRAVGDSVRPLIFLIITSIINTLLDLLFVIVFHWGIAGVGIATVISQLISSVMVLLLLIRTKEIYRFSFRDLTLDTKILGLIISYGLPAALQATITSFSNVFVQSYVNHFGSSAMAGWSCYNKIDQFIFLPITSMSMAATAFVSQNIGAGKEDRANKGTWVSLRITEIITFSLATLLFIFAGPAIGLFTKDETVIHYGILFLHLNVYFLCFNCINHTLAGALRGRGDSNGPMIIMIFSFVVLRQIYLFTATRLFGYTEVVVGLGYPVGWTICCLIEVPYFYFRWYRKSKKTT